MRYNLRIYIFLVWVNYYESVLLILLILSPNLGDFESILLKLYGIIYLSNIPLFLLVYLS